MINTVSQYQPEPDQSQQVEQQQQQQQEQQLQNVDLNGHQSVMEISQDQNVSQQQFNQSNNYNAAVNQSQFQQVNNSNIQNQSPQKDKQMQQPTQFHQKQQAKINREINNYNYFEGYICCPSHTQRICYFSLVIFYSVLLAFLAIANSSQAPEKSLNHPYEHLLESLQAKLITNIKFIQSDQNCQDLGYQEIVNYEYPGTKKGCDCSNSSLPLPESEDGRQGQLYNQPCSAEQETAGCLNVLNVKGTFLKQWSLSNNEQDSIKICGLFSNRNYFESLALRGICPGSEKVCGGSENEFNTCIPQDQECPLNYLSFTASSSEGEYMNVTQKSTGQNKKIYYSKSENAIPISFIRISQGQNVCEDLNKNHYEANIKTHILMNEEPSNCKLDDEYDQIHLINQKSFLLSNGLVGEFESIPQKELILNSVTQYGLYTKPFLPWKDACRGESMKEKIIDYKDRIKGINHGNKVISWASVIYTILVALGMGCYFYQVKRTKMVNLGMVILKFILFLVYGIIIYVVFFYLIKYDSFLQDLIDKQCTDDHYIDGINTLKEAIEDDVKPINITIFVLFNIIGLFELAALIKVILRNNRIYKYQNKQIDEQKQQQEYYQQGYPIYRNDNVENYYTGDTLVQLRQQEQYFNTVNRDSQSQQFEKNRYSSNIYQNADSVLFQSIQTRPKALEKGKVNERQFKSYNVSNIKFNKGQNLNQQQYSSDPVQNSNVKEQDIISSQYQQQMQNKFGKFSNNKAVDHNDIQLDGIQEVDAEYQMSNNNRFSSIKPQLQNQKQFSNISKISQNNNDVEDNISNILDEQPSNVQIGSVQYGKSITNNNNRQSVNNNNNQLSILNQDQINDINVIHSNQNLDNPIPEYKNNEQYLPTQTEQVLTTQNDENNHMIDFKIHNTSSSNVHPNINLQQHTPSKTQYRSQDYDLNRIISDQKKEYDEVKKLVQEIEHEQGNLNKVQQQRKGLIGDQYGSGHTPRIVNMDIAFKIQPSPNNIKTYVDHNQDLAIKNVHSRNASIEKKPNNKSPKNNNDFISQEQLDFHGNFQTFNSADKQFRDKIFTRNTNNNNAPNSGKKIRLEKIEDEYNNGRNQDLSIGYDDGTKRSDLPQYNDNSYNPNMYMTNNNNDSNPESDRLPQI